jgi:hypothetical protein
VTIFWQLSAVSLFGYSPVKTGHNEEQPTHAEVASGTCNAPWLPTDRLEGIKTSMTSKHQVENAQYSCAIPTFYFLDIAWLATCCWPCEAMSLNGVCACFPALRFGPWLAGCLERILCKACLPAAPASIATTTATTTVIPTGALTWAAAASRERST